jgi:hypothetical protein
MSNKPSLKIEMPARQSAEFRRPSATIRSPRFTEDFDAPFSEALVSEQQTTTPSSSESGSCSSYSSAQSRLSYDFSSRKVSPSSAVRTPSFPAQSPTEQWQQQQHQPEPRRRTNVNGRVREWARRSMILGRSRTVSTYEPLDRPPTTKSNNGSDDGNSDRGSQ